MGVFAGLFTVIGCLRALSFKTEERHMVDDERCCGTGTCIINAEGYCWCGQKWDGQKMCFPDRQGQDGAGAAAAHHGPAEGDGVGE